MMTNVWLTHEDTHTVQGHSCCYLPWGAEEHAKQEYEVLLHFEVGLDIILQVESFRDRSRNKR